jgi:hypothetical protein
MTSISCKDNWILLTDNEENLQQNMKNLNKALKIYDMKISTKKLRYGNGGENMRRVKTAIKRITELINSISYLRHMHIRTEYEFRRKYKKV